MLYKRMRAGGALYYGLFYYGLFYYWNEYANHSLR